MILNEHADSVDNRERDSDEETDRQLLDEHPHPVAGMDFVERDSADYQSRALRAAIARRVHNHRNEGHKHRYGGDLILIIRNNQSGQRR